MFNMRRTEAEILFVGTDMNELLLKLDKIKFVGKKKSEKTISPSCQTRLQK